ncbi:MAG: hypothetical protein KDC95_00415 [Planctomycetes bacterium]|nr:hypothetical protein [Planctomycetota bacterium]
MTWTPDCDRVWMCDAECIYDRGDYKTIVERLEHMTSKALSLEDIDDEVDIERGIARVRFSHSGQTVRWKFAVHDDWLDGSIFPRYAKLLADSNGPLRLFGNFRKFGQCALLVALRPTDRGKFVKLTRIRVRRMA